MPRWYGKTRPVFVSAEHWLEHFLFCGEQGLKPWEPGSRDELLLAEEMGILQRYPQWIPGEQGLDLLGLPPDFGRRESFSEEWQEQFLVTLATDADFQDAVRGVLHSGRNEHGGGLCP